MMHVDYEAREAMQALRGKLSKRATSAEFNEWDAREVCEYIDALRSQLEEAKEIIRVLAQANIYDDQLHEVLVSAETLRRARSFLKENGNG